MAPIKNILAALALASFTTAMPVAVDKRDPSNTVTETTWTTVDVTTTVFVNGASPMPQANNGPPPAPAVPTTTAAAAAPEGSSAAAEQQPAAQSAGNAPAAFAAQAQPPQSSPPTVSTTSAAEAAAPASTQATQGSQGTPAKSGGGSGGRCEGPGSGCAGDATHWDGGLGACGWTVNTASDMQIALPVGLMGDQSNGNPYCGRSVSIKTPNGGTVSATVGDKCMGCQGDSIDMTNALFAAALPNGDGRVSNVEWWFD